jgi:hypothetical protein
LGYDTIKAANQYIKLSMPNIYLYHQYSKGFTTLTYHPSMAIVACRDTISAQMNSMLMTAQTEVIRYAWTKFHFFIWSELVLIKSSFSTYNDTKTFNYINTLENITIMSWSSINAYHLQVNSQILICVTVFVINFHVYHILSPFVTTQLLNAIPLFIKENYFHGMLVIIVIALQWAAVVHCKRNKSAS